MMNINGQNRELCIELVELFRHRPILYNNIRNWKEGSYVMWNNGEASDWYEGGQIAFSFERITYTNIARIYRDNYDEMPGNYRFIDTVVCGSKFEDTISLCDWFKTKNKSHNKREVVYFESGITASVREFFNNFCDSDIIGRVCMGDIITLIGRSENVLRICDGCYDDIFGLDYNKLSLLVRLIKKKIKRYEYGFIYETKESKEEIGKRIGYIDDLLQSC